MSPDTFQQLLTGGDWRTLFIDELGWNGLSTQFEIALFEPGQQSRGWSSLEELRRRETMARHSFVLKGIAQKCGLAVFVCSPYKQGQIPGYLMRCEIERRVSKSNHHHLIVFMNEANTTQIWQWAHHTDEGNTEYCEHTLLLDQEDKTFLRRLEAIAFSFVEEERLTLIEVLCRVQSAFYYARSKTTQWRLRLNTIDLSQYGEGIESWTRLAYAMRGLFREEEIRLARAAKAGDLAAVERLIITHLYIPLEMAWKLKRRRGLPGVELEDLVHEGYLGLHQAIRNFEPDKGQRFQSYVNFTVWKLMDRAVLHWNRLIAIPSYIAMEFQPVISQYAIVEDRLTQWLEREPTRAEIATGLGVSLKDMADLDMLQAEFLSLETLQEQTADDEGNTSDFTDFLPMSEIERQFVLEHSVAWALSKLKKKHRQVIQMRYGLDGNDPMTLEEIGTRIDLTRERVRQIEQAALLRMQHDLLRQQMPSMGRLGRNSRKVSLTGEAADGN